jgi:hypothetical protein
MFCLLKKKKKLIRSDPESLRIEITETDHPIVGRKRDKTKNNGQ